MAKAIFHNFINFTLRKARYAIVVIRVPLHDQTVVMKRNLLFVGTLLFALLFGMAASSIQKGRYFDIIKNLEIFSNLYKEVNSNYVDEIDPNQIMKVGIDAMLATLDPFTNYFSESQIEGWRFKNEEGEASSGLKNQKDRRRSGDY